MASLKRLASVEEAMNNFIVRHQFEEHMRHVGYHQNQLRRGHHDKQYLSSTIHTMWYGWCAAIANKGDK